MQTWTETSQVKHHWVMSTTERDAVVSALEDAVNAGGLSATTSELLQNVVNAANSAVSGA